MKTLRRSKRTPFSGRSDKIGVVSDGAAPSWTGQRRVLVALGVTLVVWASAFPGIRAGLAAYDPAHLALLRFLVASGVLGAYAAVVRLRPPSPRDLPAIFAGGFMGISFYHVLLNTGELTVSAGAASLVANMVPIFTALLASAFLNERLPRAAWVGIALSMLGVTMIAVGDGGGVKADLGVLLILLAAVSQAGFFVLQKRYLLRYTALEFTTYSVWAGTLMLLVYAPGAIDAVRTAPLEATVAVAYLGVFPAAIGYVGWAYVLSAWSASRATTTLFAVPVLAFLIAWAWLGEQPTVLALLGGALALIGVSITRQADHGIRLWGRPIRPPVTSVTCTQCS